MDQIQVTDHQRITVVLAKVKPTLEIQRANNDHRRLDVVLAKDSTSTCLPLTRRRTTTFDSNRLKPQRQHGLGNTKMPQANMARTGTVTLLKKKDIRRDIVDIT